MRRADTRDISLRTAAVHLRFIFYRTVEVRGEAGCRVKFHEFRPRRNAPRGLPPPATCPAVGRLGTGPRGAPQWRHAAGTAGDTARADRGHRRSGARVPVRSVALSEVQGRMAGWFLRGLSSRSSRPHLGAPSRPVRFPGPALAWSGPVRWGGPDQCTWRLQVPVRLGTLPPRVAQLDQPLFGAVCQMCHSALSSPRAKASRRPSSFWKAAGSPGRLPPRVAQLDQPLFGAVCQMCHSALSSPRTKTSSRPSAFWYAIGWPGKFPPRDAQFDQPLFGAVCQMCHSALSSPRTKTSSRPSAFWNTTGWPGKFPPRDAQFDQPLFGAVCQMCHSALSSPRTKTSTRPSAFCASVPPASTTSYRTGVTTSRSVALVGTCWLSGGAHGRSPDPPDQGWRSCTMVGEAAAEPYTCFGSSRQA